MLLPLLLALAPASVGPAPHTPAALADLPDLTVTFYDVKGSDARAVRRSMNTQRPPDPKTGERFDARTDVSYTWSAPGGPNGCEPARAKFSRSVRMTLPRLVGGGLSRNEQAQWDRYWAALLKHERNHALIGLRGAAEMERRMKSAPSCEAGKAAVKAIGEAVSSAHVEYDRRTRHGLLEGAAFPNGSAASQPAGRSR